ncbi:MAG: ribonuclease HI [Boseongicola sp. SB0664_bin_43]|uniref:Ribonuclease H n=1 Tax=Boseongicola sp. SB0664_bin_43 TaxID=2604844 RepID=A0A6B0Y0F3_9RHOB|nr:ribonuclease HI [Boseongicola sp. SB0664_bin_43]
MTQILAYTDGACSGNPGPGGWGVLLVAKERDRVVRERELFGGEALTTNNRMELLAAIHALEALRRPSRLTLVTDSAYVKNGITSWMPAWKARGWQTSARKPVRNVDLWQRLDAAQSVHDVQWAWVKGHAGHPENERADALARNGMGPFKKRNSGQGSASRAVPEASHCDAATRPERGKARARRTRRAG